MSKIVKKAFDATQRISRAIFRGSPNLFTTEDLNRQLEIYRRDIERLGMSSVVETDLVIDVDPDDRVISWTKGNYFYYGGMEINRSLNNGEQHITITTSWTSWYVLLCRTERVVTSDDDPTHKISGAAFEDGTTNPAADHVVYDFTIVVRSSPSASGIVAILDKIFISPADEAYYYSLENFRKTGTPLVEKIIEQIKILQIPSNLSSATDTIYRGQLMSSAFNTLLKKFTLNHGLAMSASSNELLRLLEYLPGGSVREVGLGSPIRVNFRAGILIVNLGFLPKRTDIHVTHHDYNRFLDEEDQDYPYPLGCNWGDTEGVSNDHKGENYQYLGHILYNSDLHKHLERAIDKASVIYIGHLGVFDKDLDEDVQTTSFPLGLYLERIVFKNQPYWCFTARAESRWGTIVAKEHSGSKHNVVGVELADVTGYGSLDGNTIGYYCDYSSFMLPLIGI